MAATAFIGAGTQLTKLAWRGAVAGLELKEASNAIAEILPVALATAICEATPDAKDVKSAAEILSRQLTDGPLPALAKPTPGTRTKARLRGMTPKRLRPKEIPPIQPFGLKSFYDQLQEWVAEALNYERVKEAVESVECAGRPVSCKAVAERFPITFFYALADRQDSRWHAQLLEALRQKRRNATFVDDEATRLRRGRGLILELTASGAAGAAGGVIAGAHPQWVLLATVLGLALGGVGHAAGRPPARAISRAQSAARGATLDWLGDLAATISVDVEGAPPAPSVTPRHRSTTDELARWAIAVQGGRAVQIRLDDHLVEHAAGPLLQAAEHADDDELLAALITVVDALRRYQDGRVGQSTIVEALQNLIVTAAVSSTLGQGGAAPTALSQATLPDGASGTPYSYQFMAPGQPSSIYGVASGHLPDGLALSPEGTVHGTPTTAGSYTFVVVATNGAGSDTAHLTMRVV